MISLENNGKQKIGQTNVQEFRAECWAFEFALKGETGKSRANRLTPGSCTFQRCRAFLRAFVLHVLAIFSTLLGGFLIVLQPLDFFFFFFQSKNQQQEQGHMGEKHAIYSKRWHRDWPQSPRCSARSLPPRRLSRWRHSETPSHNSWDRLSGHPCGAFVKILLIITPAKVIN